MGQMELELNKYDPKIWNIKLAESIGYIFREDDIIYKIDGVEQPITILSKTPISFQESIEGEEIFKYLSMVFTKSPSSYDEIKLKLWENKVQWEDENMGFFMLLPHWNPDKDWNQLTKVARVHCVTEISTDIFKAYRSICSLIYPYAEK